MVYSKREAESGGELEQTDFLPIYDDSSMRSIPMDIASDPEGFNIYDYLGGFWKTTVLNKHQWVEQ